MPAKRFLFIGFILILSLTLIFSCEDDEVAAPDGGQAAFSTELPPGYYETSGTMWTCGDTDTVRMPNVGDAWCGSDIDDEEILPCPISVQGDTLTLKCSDSWNYGPDCIVTEHYDLTGTRTGDVWEITGTMTDSQDPDGCLPPLGCIGLHMVIRKVGPSPEFCDHGPLNKVTMSVTGGPFSPNVELVASGDLDLAGRFQATSTADVSVPGPMDYVGVHFEFDLPPVDGANLPVEIPVTTLAAATTIPDTARVLYVEWRYGEGGQTKLHEFMTDSASGTLTVNAMSDGFCAGSFSIDYEGTETNESGVQPSTRSTSGTFNVLSSGYPLASTDRSDAARAAARTVFRALAGACPGQ